MDISYYTIIETDWGPTISNSRTTVYDVLEMADAGYDTLEIAKTYNLKAEQVQVALDYIAEHGDTLRAELQEILQEKAEREIYYRALAAERQKLIDQLPMTPQRAAFYALRDQIRRRWESAPENGQADLVCLDANCS